MAKFKKYSKVKFKLRKELVIILLIAVVMAVTTVVLNLPSEKDKIYSDYAGNLSTTDHVFEKITKSKLVDLVESGEEIYVYFGSPTCSNCTTYIDTFNTQAVYWEVETVYYLDASFVDEEDREEDEDFNSELLTWESKLKDVSFDFTPSIWVYQDGELVFNSQDYIEDDDTTMMKSWDLIASEAFALNLTNKDAV